MIKNYLNRVRIDKSITPIHFSKRKTPQLTTGGNYFVSFGCNDTYPCVLTKIINEFQCPEIEIEIPMKQVTKNGSTVSSHILYANEIGVTREEAVINTASS